MIDPFPQVVPSGQLRGSCISMPAGAYHHRESGFPVAYFSNWVSEKCYRITETFADKNGINIVYIDENGSRQTVNVNPAMRVFAYMQQSYDLLMQHQD